MATRPLHLLLVSFALVVAPEVLVVGCSGGGGGGGGDDDVHGHVVSGYGAPVGFATVVVNGVVTETDYKGRFTAQAGESYELLVRDPGTGDVYVFQGVTRRDPTVTVDFNVNGSVEAEFSGTLTGGEPAPFLPETAHAFTFEAKKAGGGGSEFTPDENGAFEALATWTEGEPVATGTLSILQWNRETTGNLPAEFTGFARTPVTLRTAAATSGLSVVLTDIPEGTVSGIVSVPASYTMRSYRAFAQIADEDGNEDTSFLITLASVTTDTSFSITTAAGENFRASVGAQVRNAAAGTIATVTQQYVDPTTAGIVLEPLPPVSLVSPTDLAAINFATQTFTWDPWAGGGIYTILFQGSASNIAFSETPTIRVVTSATSMPFPDLTPLGVSIPTSGRDVRFSMSSQRADVDALLGPYDPPRPILTPITFRTASARTIRVDVAASATAMETVTTTLAPEGRE